MQTKKLDEKFYKESQSWHHVCLWEVVKPSSVPNGTSTICKVKTEIRRNAYDDQSFLRASLFCGSKWNVIIDNPMKSEYAKCFGISYVDNRPDQELFRKDAFKLMEEIKLVL